MQLRRSPRFARPIALSLIVSLLFLSSLAGPAEAMFLPIADAPTRSADLETVRKVLETRLVQQRLLDHGLSPEEATARVNTLSDDQLHQLATNLDAVQAGGDVVGTLFALALIGALVVLIIYMLQGRIAVEQK